MKYEKHHKKIRTVKISLTEEEKQLAKDFARGHDYSFQDWLGNLVVEELQRNGILEEKINHPPNII